jgi:hypothetical protein
MTTTVMNSLTAAFAGLVLITLAAIFLEMLRLVLNKTKR